MLLPYSIRVENPTSPIFFTDWIFYFGLAYSLTLFFPFCHHYRTPIFLFNSPQQRGSLKRTEIFQVSIAKKWFSDNRNRSGKNKWFNVFRYLPISYPLFHIMSLMNQSWDIHWKSMNSLCHAYPWCIHKCTCKEFKFLIWIKIQCNMYNIGCAVPESKKKNVSTYKVHL